MKREHAIYNSKGKIWTAIIAAALVAAVAVFAAMMQLEHKMLTAYEKVTVITAGKAIPKGTVISTDNSEVYFTELEVDKKMIPNTAVMVTEQIEEMVAVADIEVGVLLTTGMFDTVDEITTGMPAPVVAGLRAEDLYQVVGGTLRTGDRINIYHVTEEGNVTVDWEDVYIQEVFDNAGNAISAEDTRTAAQRINVYLDESDVEQFYEELAKGSLRIVKVCN